MNSYILIGDFKKQIAELSTWFSSIVHASLYIQLFFVEDINILKFLIRENE